jgi:hypothetical protein
MATRLIRLAFLISALALAMNHTTARLRAFEGQCTCNFSTQSGGVYFYDDDWTFINQANGTDTLLIDPLGSEFGAYFCENSCVTYALSLGAPFCNTYGPGHRINFGGTWTYEDPDSEYGGSGFGYFDTPNTLYECS